MRIVLALLLSLLWADGAIANCAPTTAALGFTPASSYDVRAGSVAPATGLAGLTCSGAFLGLLGGNSAKATVTSANGYRLSAGGADTIPYQVSADPGGAWSFSQGRTIDYFDPTLVSLLGIGGASSFTAALHGRLTATPNVPAGVYRDTLTVSWSWSVCDGVQTTALVCLPNFTTGRATVTIAVTLVVGKDCRITAPDVDFGSAALVGGLAPVRGVVLLSCTKDASYSVGFTAGQSGQARPWRTMTDGLGHTLQYNVYRPDGTTVWDQSYPVSAPGTGDTVPTQPLSYVARVNADQPTPPAGRYTDMLSIVVSF